MVNGFRSSPFTIDNVKFASALKYLYISASK
jgi:hypothetical protein